MKRKSSPEFLTEARRELERCMRALLPRFPEATLPAFPPEIRVEPGSGRFKRRSLESLKRHELVFYAEEHLGGSAEEILTVLLHKMVHAANAVRRVRDASHQGYHNQRFRELAEGVGFRVERLGRRFGWAHTLPGPELAEDLRRLALDGTVFPDFRSAASEEPRRWRCGLTVFPELPRNCPLEKAARRARQAPVEEPAPALRPRRPAGERRATVSQLMRGPGCVPVLRLSGEWLREAGFEEGRLCRVEVGSGRLVLHAVRDAEPP